jgi:ABC-type multidrug transport system fused ATPase/permease subunit
MEIVFKLLNTFVWCGIAIAFLWGLLALINKKFRMSYGAFLCFLSYLMGFQVWAICAAFVYEIWGIIGLAIGTLLFGVGVVPLALLAGSIHGIWSPVIITLISLAMIFLCHWGGEALFDKEKARREADNIPAIMN